VNAIVKTYSSTPFLLSHLQTALQNSGIVPDVIDGVKLEEAVNHEDLA